MDMSINRSAAVAEPAFFYATGDTEWLQDAGTGVYPVLKRTIDVIGAGIGLLLLSPLFLVVAVLIKLDSPGPVLFAQTRVGRQGRLFRCWKLRSMFIDAEARKAELLAANEMQGGTTFKMKRDPRITRVGRFIRKASIDELPQLWNVLTGDMSLVGPRPPVPQEVAEYTPHQRQRLAVTPGITCIWQVSGRSDIPFEQQVELDLEYISKRSLTFDIRLLLSTVPAVLFARGAY
jgi:exopolysaccharide biosynthesis polyprenyl glycosylphosphotransferase